MTVDIRNAAALPHYAGEHTIPGIEFAAAGAAMGITAFLAWIYHLMLARKD